MKRTQSLSLPVLTRQSSIDTTLVTKISIYKKGAGMWDSGADVYGRKRILERETAAGQHCFETAFIDGLHIGVHWLDRAVFDVLK